MRTRKFTITAFLLCAMLILGVGFATLTDNFTITGYASITEDAAEDVLNNDVYFTGVVVGEELKSDILETAGLGYTASVNVADDSATYHVNNLKTAGEYVEITFQVKNDFDREVTLKIEENDITYTDAVGTDAGVFKVEYDLVDNSTIAAEGGTKNIKVKVTVLKTPARDISATFTFKFKAEVEPAV